MWDKDKAVLITNNDLAYEKYRGEMTAVMLDSYEQVLIKARDMVHRGHVLLTHPQASSLKPNQTPYRSIVLYPNEGGDTDSILLMEKCLENYYRWQEISPSPRSYPESVKQDFKAIDLSVMEGIMPRII